MKNKLLWDMESYNIPIHLRWLFHKKEETLKWLGSNTIIPMYSTDLNILEYDE